jgi:hypothetical protein
MWPLPRELLWALIGSLAIVVAALWPSHYPYSQAPKVHPQQQTKDSIGGQDSSHRTPSSPIEGASEQNRQHGGEHTAETTILGIKPGEWLLGIVTWMLWLATVRLVTNADKTAERQLRAYIGIEDVKILYANEEWQPNIRITYKNFGKTPAYNLENRCKTVFSIVGEPSFDDLRKESGNISDIWPSQERTTTIMMARTIFDMFKKAVENKGIRFFVYGEIHYRDAFGAPRWTKYRLQLDPDDEGIKEDAFIFCAKGNESN